MKNIARLLLDSFLFCLIAGGLFACDGASNNPAAGSTSDSTNNTTPDSITNSNGMAIAWYEGSVESAFATAKAENKPLYLYWGAVWCPPCEEIKQTVFKSPAFIQQSRLFVPVYLDGDTPRAQTWGERFGVKGYPTMIVFNPAGEEVTRIPGGIDVQLYAEVLGKSLESLQPTETLIRTAVQNPAQLSGDDFLQLAYYSWEQFYLPNVSEEELAGLLQDLADLARPENGLAASRLQLQSLALLSYQQEPALPKSRDELQQHLASILNDQRQVAANLDLLTFYCKEIMALVTESGPARQQLGEQWIAAMEQVRQTQNLSGAERLASWYPAIHFYWLANPEAERLNDELIASLRDAVRRADEETAGSARQSVIHRASRVLQAANLWQDSRELLAAEIEKSHSAYYFMSSLAEVEEELGNTDSAVQWLQRAYESAEGEATQFQWGVEYASGLIRMQPEQSERIIETAQQVINGLARPADIFAGRNFGRLQTLLANLEEWQNEHGGGAAELEGLREQLAARCGELDKESQQFENCSELLLAEA